MKTDAYGHPIREREFPRSIQELEFQHAVQKGLDSLERKDRVPLDEARGLLPLAAGQYPRLRGCSAGWCPTISIWLVDWSVAPRAHSSCRRVVSGASWLPRADDAVMVLGQ